MSEQISAYDIVVKSREKTRPTCLTYIQKMISGFIELKGDRKFADDKAVVGGIGWLGDLPVTVVGIEKGSSLTDKMARNFGCAAPEGYRKALRLFKQAEKFNRPILCLVDTSGAACGIGAEERGQAQAIADNLMEMMQLKVPVLSLIIGEGGSGGALGLAVANQVWITETATYSVISPEGCASILWKDSAKVKDASDALGLTANDLLSSKAVDKVVKEDGFSDTFFNDLKDSIYSYFCAEKIKPALQLMNERYERFRTLY